MSAFSDFFKALRAGIAEIWPGRECNIKRIDVWFKEESNPLSLLMPYPGAQAPADQTPPPAPPVFVPTPFQEAILTALEGKALRSDALGAAVGDRSRLFRHPGGLRELQDHGMVAHHNRRGYYRPDCPPEELDQ